MRSSRNARHYRFVVGVVLCGCVAAMLPSAANGDLVFPTTTHSAWPDICTLYTTVNYTYDAGSGNVSVQGWPWHYGDDSGPDITGGELWSFNISGTVSPSSGSTGPLDVSDGLLTIYGSLTNGPDELLLSGTVDRMGVLDSVPGYLTEMDFSFHVTGGSLAGAYGGNGALGGTTLALYASDGDTAFTSLEAGFSYNGGENTNDTFSPVPEPSSSALMLVSIVAGLATSMWRRFGTRRD
jgi:hypothetical protein